MSQGGIIRINSTSEYDDNQSMTSINRGESDDGSQIRRYESEISHDMTEVKRGDSS